MKYCHFRKYFSRLFKGFNKSQQAQFRLEVIEFQMKYETGATIGAFGVSQRKYLQVEKETKTKGLNRFCAIECGKKIIL